MTRDEFDGVSIVPKFETYANYTQIWGVSTARFAPSSDSLVECTFGRVDCSGLESVYGHNFSNWRRTKTNTIEKGKWQFWLWMASPGASPEAGFRM